ncbi:hypothetical protein ACFO3D_12360 [Virgibacillus kekensis]|uniref:Condensation domain-containing protein n=1 Tax=Virgibacillus kekensis TaxID=202261 RepID=A0ABV9DJR5_9BACI
MLIELLYELIGEASPMSLYLGIALSLIGHQQLMNIGQLETGLSQYDYIHELHNHYYNLQPRHESTIPVRDIYNWITHTTKRIDSPDDDSDNHSFSFPYNQHKRGGHNDWKKTLYSLSLNTAH